MKLALPTDVAPIKTENESLFLVFIFPDEETSWSFYLGLIKDKEISLGILKEDTGTYTFIFRSSNSPQEFHIKTPRTVENNSQLKMITNPDYTDYCYLSCGYKAKQQQQILYNPEGIPVFVNVL